MVHSANERVRRELGSSANVAGGDGEWIVETWDPVRRKTLRFVADSLDEAIRKAKSGEGSVW